VSNPRCRVRSSHATFPVCIAIRGGCPPWRVRVDHKRGWCFSGLQDGFKEGKDHRLLTEPPHCRPVSILSAVTTPSFGRGGIDRLREG
jgi:hypothetical protein